MVVSCNSSSNIDLYHVPELKSKTRSRRLLQKQIVLFIIPNLVDHYPGPLKGFRIAYVIGTTDVDVAKNPFWVVESVMSDIVIVQIVLYALRSSHALNHDYNL